LAYPVFLFMVKYEQKIGIKSLAPADRPREKLILNGRRHLSDAELIAILISSGNKTETSVEVSQRILLNYGNDLDLLAKASFQELILFKGIGEAKALSIIAALELGRRRKEKPHEEFPQIHSSNDAFDLLRPVLADLDHEEFWMLILNKANFVICKHMISKGGQASTTVDPKIIFEKAIAMKAAYLILAHNHPSGNCKPSKEDIEVTRKLVEAGLLLDTPVLDHLIITNKKFYSMADEEII
jgi:DNA repair protein RadC